MRSINVNLFVNNLLATKEAIEPMEIIRLLKAKVRRRRRRRCDNGKVWIKHLFKIYEGKVTKKGKIARKSCTLKHKTQK